jgi:hypothetical protein
MGTNPVNKAIIPAATWVIRRVTISMFMAVFGLRLDEANLQQRKEK